MNLLSFRLTFAALTLLFAARAAHSADYRATIESFRNASQSAGFFANSYGYAVFPVVGEGHFTVRGAHGDGRVYAHGVRVGTASVSQLSIGWQAGGEAYSEIIFFKDQRALDAFESGTFEFGAGATAVVMTAVPSASVDTGGTAAAAGDGKRSSRVARDYSDGMLVFTIVKEGLENGASVEGEKFTYHGVELIAEFAPRGGYSR